MRFRRRNRDLDAEIESHLAMARRDRIERGESPAEAELHARREFGSDALVREVTRQMWGQGALDRLGQDLHYAARALRRSPGFTLAAVLTLAVGIGATTALFSAIEAELLRPLPYSHPRELVALSRPSPAMPSGAVLSPEFQAWLTESREAAGLAAWNDQQFNLTRAGEPEMVQGATVNAAFLRTLGVHPLLGRDLEAADDAGGKASVVLVGYGLWQRHFGGNEQWIGRAILLNDQPYTVIGVLPRGFRFPGDLRAELMVPGGYSRAPDWKAASMGLMHVIGRPRSGVSAAQLTAELQAIEGRHDGDVPAFFAPVWRTGGVQAMPLADVLSGRVRLPLLVLWGAVTLVLLLICANLAGLQLARASARTGEWALRAALGASRVRLARPLIAESVLVALGGGALGLIGAWWLVRGLRTLAALRLPAPDAIALNRPVMLFGLAVTLITGLLAGLGPALAASRTNLQESMRGASRSVSRAWRGGLRSTLVVGEVALALVLSLGAGLMLRSVARLISVPMGIRTERLLTMRLRLQSDRYRQDEQRQALVEGLLQKAHSLPGVEKAAVVSALPLTGYNLGAAMHFEGRQEERNVRGPSAAVIAVSSEYFAVMGIPLLEGTGFRGAESQPVAVVNQAFARQFYAGRSAVGQRLRIGATDANTPWTTIVGVVGDVRHQGPGQPAQAELFSPYRQRPLQVASLVVRSSVPPDSLSTTLRREIHSLDSDLPVFDLSTMEARVAAATAPERLELLLIGFFALLATVLAALGVYGVIAYAVSQSTHEIGVRLALGAQPGRVQRGVVARGLRLGLAGVVLGLAGGYALTTYLKTLLFETQSHDAATFAVTSGVLLLMAIAASYLPALRAARIDPIAALRSE